jgi:hypothetical protein
MKFWEATFVSIMLPMRRQSFFWGGEYSASNVNDITTDMNIFYVATW